MRSGSNPKRKYWGGVSPYMGEHLAVIVSCGRDRIWPIRSYLAAWTSTCVRLSNGDGPRFTRVQTGAHAP